MELAVEGASESVEADVLHVGSSLDSHARFSMQSGIVMELQKQSVIYNLVISPILQSSGNSMFQSCYATHLISVTCKTATMHGAAFLFT